MSPSASDGARRVLVTGGAGFVGGHLVRLLATRGHEVTVFDLSSPPAADSRARYVQGSILDRAALRRALDGVDWVFHLAANPNLWAADDDEFFRVNHAGTKTVLEEATLAGAKRIVHTSTESILVSRLRERNAGLVDETVERRLDDMCGRYCQSKLLAEQEALRAAAAGAPVVVVNPTMPIGEEDHRLTPPTRMLLDFLRGRNPAYLEFAFNLVDVRDVALGHLLAAERGRVGQRYILGGVNVTLSQLLAMLRELTGRPMPTVRIPYAVAWTVAAIAQALADHVTGKPPMATLTGIRLAGAGLRIDGGKAARELGYVAGPLGEAVRRAVAWLVAAKHLQLEPNGGTP